MQICLNTNFCLHSASPYKSPGRYSCQRSQSCSQQAAEDLQSHDKWAVMRTGVKCNTTQVVYTYNPSTQESEAGGFQV
jgi:hypothetical protein